MKRGLLLAVLLGLTVAPSALGYAVVEGTVSDFNSGAGIPLFEVVVFEERLNAGVWGCTDANGNFLIKVPPGSYKLLYQGPRKNDADCDPDLKYSSSWYAIGGSATTVQEAKEFFVPEAGTFIDLHSAQLGGTMTGKVTRQGTDRALSNATVTLLDLERYPVTTVCSDNDGNFSATRMRPVPYRVQVDSPGSCGPVLGEYFSQFYGNTTDWNSGTVVNVPENGTAPPVNVALVPKADQIRVDFAGTGTGAVDLQDGYECSFSCTRNLPHGQATTLTPVAGVGSRFAGWSGACTGTGACTLTLDDDKAVVATFEPDPADPRLPKDLTITFAGSGAGTVIDNRQAACSATCSRKADAGSVVTLTAMPVPGVTFDGWSGDCSGTGTCQVTMSVARNVTATFTAPVSGASGGTGAGSGATGGAGGQPTAAKPRCTVRSTSAKARKGKLTVAYSCDQGVRLTLTTKLTQRVGRRTRAYVVRAVRGTAQAGVSGRLTVTLPAAAVTALRRHRALAAVFTLRATNAAGLARATASIKKVRA